MPRYGNFFHKKNPFVRLLLAFVTGILLHWYTQPPVILWFISGGIAFLFSILYFFLPIFERFRHTNYSGSFLGVLFISIGALLAWNEDTRNNENWFGDIYKRNDFLIVRLEEPLTEKARSFKATASVLKCMRNGRSITCDGKILVYLTKNSPGTGRESSITQLRFGSQIVFRKPLQEIRNSGNPGGFDYQRYCLFKGITHQVFLKPGEWIEIPRDNYGRLKRWLFSFREKILGVLRENIPGEKESGLAEALLIGYKDDLDPSLVRSYSNTGVVHIIAISGLHLGLIYSIIVLLLKPVKKLRKLNLLRFFIIIAVLWGFSLLAGAQPSVLRSALMFTFIALGECMDRKTSIFNSIAASAFVLLCINPYWLWDLGFQLSYFAVLSIVIFMRPVYNLIYCRNRLLDLAWKLNAVTLAAQVLTLPLCIYHFHQFPVYFILSNFLAVPLSSAILLGEIFLCIFSFFPGIALITGQILSWLIKQMNEFIQKIESLPGSVWDGLQVSGLQVCCLFILIVSFYTWINDRKTGYAVTGLLSLLLFGILRTASFNRSINQEKLIVYNIPQKKAVDIIFGRYYLFIGDSSLILDDFAKNFHLKPSRSLHRITEKDMLPAVIKDEYMVQLNGKRILMIDRPVNYSFIDSLLTVDLLIISGKQKIKLTELTNSFRIKQLVVDASVPYWKSAIWKKTCDSLRIIFYDVKEKGAFVMNLR